MNKILKEWLEDKYNEMYEGILEDEIDKEEEFNSQIALINAIGKEIGFTKITYQEYLDDLQS